ncbi:MAG TPA: hypothetical protein PLR71_06715 [Deltaproteobacteria bacterium]|nr:hypothetical protein [Deltaproteobacteria bacterium]
MRHYFPFLAVAITLVLNGPALALERQVAGGALFSWWQDDNDDSGTQIAIPIRAGLTYGQVRAQILNAYVSTSVDMDKGGSVSLSGFVDTKVNASYTLERTMGMDVLAGLGLNLPTGQTDFTADELVLTALPPELLPITSYGEGFNVNPYLAVSREWERAAAGCGIGYLWRGEYDYSELMPEFDPGDVITLTAEGRYSHTDFFQSRLFAQYATYGKDSIDGEDYSKEGYLILFGAGGTCSRPAWQLDADLYGIFRGKTRYYVETATPMDDEKNYGDEFRANFLYRYFLTSTLTLKSSLGFLTMGENGYDKDSGFYAGGRQKISLGFGAEKEFLDGLKANLDLTLFTLKEKENFYHPDDDLTFTGILIGGGLQKTF